MNSTVSSYQNLNEFLISLNYNIFIFHDHGVQKSLVKENSIRFFFDSLSVKWNEKFQKLRYPFDVLVYFCSDGELKKTAGTNQTKKTDSLTIWYALNSNHISSRMSFFFDYSLPPEIAFVVFRPPGRRLW